MKKRNRWLALILAGVMLLATDCGAKPGNSGNGGGDDVVTEGPHGIKYAQDQTLHLVYSTEAETLHPYSGSNTAGTWQAISNLCEGLTSVDQYGNFVPGLAESHEVSDDGLVLSLLSCKPS